MRDAVEPRLLDLRSWERREHFEFFREYENPFFNICAEVDVSRALQRTREPGGPSFFLASLYCSLRAGNDVEPFRYRIRDDQVVVHETIHAGTTVLTTGDRFAFAYFDFATDLASFASEGEKVLEAVPNEGPLLDDQVERDDLIHYSVIPWISFTSFSHASPHGRRGSIPRLVFGKYHGADGAERMPVSVEVHHALMDGVHVARFFERFQAHLND